MFWKRDLAGNQLSKSTQRSPNNVSAELSLFNMQFARKETRKRTIVLGTGRNPELYPHNLQFYTIPPTDNISLQEFEDFAVERLKGES